MNKWTRVNFQPNLPLHESGRVTAGKEHIQLSKEAAKEGMVLLKNENNVLPLKKGSRIALFGKGSFDYVKGGGGSGDVTVSYVHNLYDGLKMQGNVVQIYEPLCPSPVRIRWLILYCSRQRRLLSGQIILLGFYAYDAICPSLFVAFWRIIVKEKLRLSKPNSFLICS